MLKHKWWGKLFLSQIAVVRLWAPSIVFICPRSHDHDHLSLAVYVVVQMEAAIPQLLTALAPALLGTVASIAIVSISGGEPLACLYSI